MYHLKVMFVTTAVAVAATVDAIDFGVVAVLLLLLMMMTMMMIIMMMVYMKYPTVPLNANLCHFDFDYKLIHIFKYK